MLRMSADLRSAHVDWVDGLKRAEAIIAIRKAVEKAEDDRDQGLERYFKIRFQLKHDTVNGIAASGNYSLLIESVRVARRRAY